MGNWNGLTALARQLGAGAEENVPLSEHTTFKIGGPCDVFITPVSEASFAALFAHCREAGIPALILGNGSNLLVSDEGFRGAVFSTGGLCGLSLSAPEEISCGAGVRLSKVCRFALTHSLTGLEFAFGIPGSAGGAAFMNAGAYGGEMKDVLAACTHIDENGAPGEFAGEALQLSYRHSRYSGGGYVITGLSLHLRAGREEDIRAQMDDYAERRRSKQPLEYPSAGSVFKRPEGYYAGALIQQCGLKGASVGGAQVSPKHAGFIINTGGATCSDVLRLIEKIQATVLRETGVSLECEVRRV